ncbi:hypothetical protein Tco_0987724 [Tanacetum coccineum]
MDAFRVLKTQCQLFINFWYYFDDDDDGLMIRKYFLAYTRTEVQQFRDTLIQHMESVKKSIDERAQHKREWYQSHGAHDLGSNEGLVYPNLDYQNPNMARNGSLDHPGLDRINVTGMSLAASLYDNAANMKVNAALGSLCCQ